eukprot:TRINITY_DN8351_c0_g1_i1.p1 TRINITY_DN8351_c0_g1~~TRINITY_DN8351_c0_g1_i1.p1  ORF type:complete len:462 (+),score=89.97 TRINITY_DN8351_c0_g1_i1:67-1386(+)
MTDDYLFPKDLLYKIPPYQYLHVLNRNTNVVEVFVGPRTYRCKEEEKVVYGPANMIIIPPGHYVIVDNPVCRNLDGTPAFDKFGQVKLRHGDQEVRLEQDPFPLYPGEKISSRIQPLQVVAPNTALRLQAIRDFIGPDKQSYYAGQEWLFHGPGTYIPQKEVRIVHTVKAIVLQPNQALHLRARKALRDYLDHPRKAGEEWLVRKEGAYLPDVDEVVVKTVNAYVLTDKKALHLRAIASFEDCFGIQRRAGEEWLVTRKHCETHIPGVYETVIGEVNITSLTKRQWCTIANPIKKRYEGGGGEVDDDNDPAGFVPLLGKHMIIRGEKNFFLHPGEILSTGIREVYVLGEDQALLLKAVESFDDVVGEKKKIVRRKPGEKWLICGPIEYWPILQAVEVRQLNAVLKVEPLHLNIFEPEILLLALGAVVVLFILFIKLLFW